MPAIYHFTDLDNLERVLVAGELRSHRNAATAVDIADASIKDRRTRIDVTCGPGGKVGDYVPFYFAPRSPMLFSIKCGNVAGVSADQRRLAYLTSSSELVLEAAIACVFTDGNASAAFSEFYDEMSTLAEVVDWPLMRERYWRNTPEDSDRRRRRGAEFLVHGAVPLTLVTEIGVYGDTIRTQVQASVTNAGLTIPVRVRRDWYF
jgi:hypothetical protein